MQPFWVLSWVVNCLHAQTGQSCLFASEHACDHSQWEDAENDPWSGEGTLLEINQCVLAVWGWWTLMKMHCFCWITPGTDGGFGVELYSRGHGSKTPFTQDVEHLATGVANYRTHCSKWECSHRLQATSKGLHANLHTNLLTCPVWMEPKKAQVYKMSKTGNQHKSLPTLSKNAQVHNSILVTSNCKIWKTQVPDCFLDWRTVPVRNLKTWCQLFQMDITNFPGNFGPCSHMTHKQICAQIWVQTLWCCLQPVWTLPFTAVCSRICVRMLQGAPHPVGACAHAPRSHTTPWLTQGPDD